MVLEKTLKSWDEFDRIEKKRPYRNWIYRGHQVSSWQLESSLHRSFKESEKISTGINFTTSFKLSHERTMIQRFMSNAHLFLDCLPQQNDGLSWLALMQHYGAPTRLLDFSFSPYVAVYFALEAGEGDAAIYCINHKAIKRVDKELFGESLTELHNNVLSTSKTAEDSILYAFEPKFTNQRIMAQQGVFLVPNTLSWSHQDILDEYNLSCVDIYKWIIPSKLRNEGIHLLQRRNIVSSMLYPGIEGFCKSFKHQSIFNRQMIGMIGHDFEY